MSGEKRDEEEIDLAEGAAPNAADQGHEVTYDAGLENTPEPMGEIADEGELGDLGDLGDPSELAAQLEKSQLEAADFRDKLLRAMAELENVRRRAERDKVDGRKYAVAEFARNILTVPDNLRRALDATPAEGHDAGTPLAKFVEGVELTERELLSVLERHDIQQINPVGEKLDPNLHQAMVQVDHPEAPAGTIIDVLQVGYVLHDRLLRPAMVAVAKGPDGGNGDSLDAGQTIDTTA